MNNDDSRQVDRYLPENEEGKNDVYTSFASFGCEMLCKVRYTRSARDPTFQPRESTDHF